MGGGVTFSVCLYNVVGCYVLLCALSLSLRVSLLLNQVRRRGRRSFAPAAHYCADAASSKAVQHAYYTEA